MVHSVDRQQSEGVGQGGTLLFLLSLLLCVSFSEWGVRTCADYEVLVGFSLQEASMKKERATMSDEQRERTLIAEQIERAQQEQEDKDKEADATPPPAVETGLKRDEGAEKVVLAFSVKPAAPSAAPTTAGAGAAGAAPAFGFKMNPLKATVNPLKAGSNPLKRAANPLKGGGTSSADAEKANEKKRPASDMTAAERLMLEDQERKRRRVERDNRA